MSRYALLVPAYTGHLNPMIALGRAVERRGHHVTLLSTSSAAAKIGAAGFEFRPIADAEFPDGKWQQMSACAGALTGLRATAAAAAAIALLTRGILRDLPIVAQRERFDGVVMDQICIGAESVCAVIDLPLAVACNALAMHIESTVPPSYYSWRWQTGLPFRIRNFLGQCAANMCGLDVLRHLGPYRFRHRLAPMGYHYINELRPSLVQVAQQPATFDFPRRQLPNHFHYTGPWIDERAAEKQDFPWHRLDGRPLIYASLGTLQNQMEGIYRTITEACVGLDVQLVLSLGREIAETPAEQQGNAIVVGYAPQLALLERAALVITHAGLNTTLEALRAGVPLVALPIANDQPGNAQRIAHLGLGKSISLKTLTAEKLRVVVLEVLRSSAFSQRTRDFAVHLRGIDGASLASELIERAFTTRRRVIRN